MTGDNVISFTRAKFVRDIQRNRFLKVHSVVADPMTGEWKTTPEPTHQMVSEVYWSNQENTSELSHELAISEDGIEYALLVHWEHQ